MELQTSAIKPEGRFAALLGSEPFSQNAYDHPLHATPDWVVAPTLGAIVPNWMIVVPRRPALNFCEWQQQTGMDPATIVACIREHLSIADDRVLWFEHGPKLVGTEVGCGLDYAHLHIIIDPEFSFDTLMRKVEASETLDWRMWTSKGAYSRLSGHDSYMMIGTGDNVKFAEHVEQAGSQFLRKNIAELVGRASLWNYRHHPHHENITQTIDTFRALERAAWRGR